MTAGMAIAAEDIGEAAAIATNVEASLDGNVAIIKQGDRVFQNQVVTTDATGVAQIEFRDETKLAIGPSSTLTLDEFVYSPSGSASKVAIDLARGSLRFLTGRSSGDVYEITTPSATIGVRGTAFDIYAHENGEVALAMIDGAVIVCPIDGDCRDHDVTGKFLHLADGLIVIRDTWDGTFLADVPFVVAFPFLSDQSQLLDGLQGSVEVVGSYVVTAGETIVEIGVETGKTVQKTGEAAATVIDNTLKAIVTPKAKPKVKLPGLFK